MASTAALDAVPRAHCPRTHPQPSPPPPRYVRPRGLRIWNLFKQLLPLLAWGATTLGFLLAIAFWRTELFAGLDRLSRWLRQDAYFGSAVLFCLIFLTTFPPLPLYSTLITLSGYTFGAWTGALISYGAALSGALVVFVLARAFLRDAIARWLQSTRALARAVRAVERRPSLLFLVRLAPYPYNVLNALLAACPALALRTYALCTALSLVKVVVHTSIGAGIRSFADPDPDAAGGGGGEGEGGVWARAWTAGGIALCVALFVYLSWVARRAVDDELADDAGAAEERVAFLGPGGGGDDGDGAEMGLTAPVVARREGMAEAQLVPPRPLAAR